MPGGLDVVQPAAPSRFSIAPLSLRILSTRAEHPRPSRGE